MYKFGLLLLAVASSWRAGFADCVTGDIGTWTLSTSPALTQYVPDGAYTSGQFYIPPARCHPHCGAGADLSGPLYGPDANPDQVRNARYICTPIHSDNPCVFDTFDGFGSTPTHPAVRVFQRSNELHVQIVADKFRPTIVAGPQSTTMPTTMTVGTPFAFQINALTQLDPILNINSAQFGNVNIDIDKIGTTPPPNWLTYTENTVSTVKYFTFNPTDPQCGTH